MALVRLGRSLFSKRVVYSPNRKEHGYVVLLPEIGEDAVEKNPLYHNDGLPKFNEITIENCRAAISKQSLDYEVGIQEIEEKIKNNQIQDVFEDIIEPLEKLGNPMETTWGVSKTLYLGNNTLMPTSSYMAIHERARRARAAKFTSKSIHGAITEDLANRKNRSTEQTRVMRKFAIEGKLNGLELSERDADVFNYNSSKLTKQKTEFKTKNEVALKQHSQLIRDPGIVRDFPENLLKATAIDPSQYMNGPWKFTIQPPVYMPLLEHCPDREVRWLLWKSYVNRGSNTGEKELSTSLHVEEIRLSRTNIAKTLGYKNFVDMSMETKMAGNREEVNRVLDLLLQRAKPSQDEELNNLLMFANEKGLRANRLELWDVPYWRRKQKIILFDYDDNKLKNFFPLNTVLNGLFQLCEKLFNIVIKMRTGVTTWHKDVKFYDVFEPHSSAPVAGFYIDPYARSEDKLRLQNSDWMIGMQSKSQVTDSKPYAALIFNFELPRGDLQSHLTFNEVRTLFQKFGHCLQHLLSRTYYSEVAGLSNVEWDAVEVSGHMLAHWLFNQSVIESITCHSGSGDKLPKPIFENLCKAQQHLAAYDLCNELYLSVLDLELHSTNTYWLDVVKHLWPQYKTLEFHSKIDAHPCNFTQILSEEWAAAYYSHVWSRMIAADVYSAFYEAGEDERQIREVGKRFRDTFLALGGSQHSSQIFREFRGRDPSHKALLKSLGLKKAKQES
ncbi:hypothetical protein ABEB36_006981 [Hypothenemus hampei]|uniref:Peptidase M3A/M3B catalytic domain-containing protein n=1 Tax=Hypothenemus hampei TaxID=57062 RepID=A0ABD1ESF0_HYPHA